MAGKVKKAMVSVPMLGRTEEEVRAIIEEKKEYLENKLGYTVIDSYIVEDVPDNVEFDAVYLLGKSLELMSECQLVYFCNGYNNARGCRIELSVAQAYGLDILFENNSAAGMTYVV